MDLINRIVILHEYGEPSHYTGLVRYAELNRIPVEFRDFNFFKKILISIRRRNYMGILKAFEDLYWMLKMLFFPRLLRGSYCIVGIAPFDIMIIPMRRILSYSKYIYHTSWLYWDGADHPKKTYFFSTFIRRSWRLFLKKASSVATVTDDARKSLNVNYPETRGKTNVVYHSFNDQIFRYKGNKNKRLRVTYLGRMEKYKGINTIIRLVGERPNIDFCFIGSGQEVSKIKELSYEFDNLEYAGYLKNKIEIADYLNATDVLIMPSIKIDGWEELFGIALIEAMTCGCVPIATKHKGPVTILGNTVFKTHLFDEDCIEKGAIEIFDYLEDNHDYLTKLKEEAVKISRQYNMEAISKLWEGILSNERR